MQKIWYFCFFSWFSAKKPYKHVSARLACFYLYKDMASREEEKIINKYAWLKKRAIFRIEKKYDDKMQKDIDAIGSIKKPKKNTAETKYITLLQKYARLRDVWNDWLGPCISCGKVIHWKDANGWHYISRKKKSTKYNLENINLQCVYCNKYLHGNPEWYRTWLIKKLWLKKVEYIERLAKTPWKSLSIEFISISIENVKKIIDQELDRVWW